MTEDSEIATLDWEIDRLLNPRKLTKQEGKAMGHSLHPTRLEAHKRFRKKHIEHCRKYHREWMREYRRPKGYRTMNQTKKEVTVETTLPLPGARLQCCVYVHVVPYC